MGNYEDKFLGQLFLKRLIDKAYERSKQLIEKFGIKIDDFTDLYSGKGVENDKAEVERLKAEFEKRDTPEQKEFKKMADVLEVILFDLIYNNCWLGDDATPIKTTEYDDYINKIDLVVEFMKDSSATYLGLGIDATFSIEKISEKMQKLKENIKRGQLSRVKYFFSEKVGLRGELINLPSVIIAVDKKTILELCEKWQSRDKDLKTNFIQHQIIEQILVQLNLFQKIAEQEGNKKLAERFESVKNIIEGLKAKNKSIDSGQRDEAHTALLTTVNQFYKEINLPNPSAETPPERKGRKIIVRKTK